jgi:hypothetical protein
MTRNHILSTIISIVAITFLVLAAATRKNGAATSAPADAGSQAGSSGALPSGADAQAQLKELQKQVAALQAGVSQTPRIIAMGTATFHLGAVQDNATNARVKLDPGVAARLGADYIVLLTNRFPAGGYPFFDAYWSSLPSTLGWFSTTPEPSMCWLANST